MTSAQTVAAIRFGYGLPLPDAAPVLAVDLFLALRQPDRMAAVWPIIGAAEFLPLYGLFTNNRKLARTDPAARALDTALAADITGMVAMAERATLARALDASDGFRERLVAFWANHFTVVGRNRFISMLPYCLVEDAIRPNLTGYFADLLTAVTLHPAMLDYLDQATSVGPHSPLGKRKDRGMNENLARELLELHSLGVSAGYSQNDVRQMAKLLTGLTYDAEHGQKFDPRMVEPGAETVLGRQYDQTGLAAIRAALRDLAQRPETASHIARKIAVHFVADDPDPDLVDHLRQTYLQTGGDLLQVYGALLGHSAAWAPVYAKARQPQDFLVAALRALGVSGARVMAMPPMRARRVLHHPLVAMGQPPKSPDGPNGWPEAADRWITPQGLAVRISWAMQMPGRLMNTVPDPADFARACLADRADAELTAAVSRAEDRVQGVGLVLASAEFNRR